MLNLDKLLEPALRAAASAVGDIEALKRSVDKASAMLACEDLRRMASDLDASPLRAIRF
jgi:hypothetical protein